MILSTNSNVGRPNSGHLPAMFADVEDTVRQSPGAPIGRSAAPPPPAVRNFCTDFAPARRLMAGFPYQLRITGPAARVLAGRLPEKVAAAVHEFIATTLVQNPQRVGKQLLPPFAGTWSARRGAYRVLCEIDDTKHMVTVTAVEHRSDAYRSR